MKRGLIVISSTGVVTSLKLWNTMKVAGCSLVLANASASDDQEQALVVAELGSEEEAQAMFRAVGQRIQYKARTFDAREWPGLMREEATDTQEGSGE